jgi:hypothetical protein
MNTQSRARAAGPVKVAVAAAVLQVLAGSNAYAAGAVALQTWDGGINALGPGGAISVTGYAGNNSAYTDNPLLNYSSWAHTGAWWNFQLTGAATTTVRVQAQAAQDFWPGFSIWASGASAFDGGTTGFGAELSSAGFGTPHSLNSTGALGAAGTLWMQNGQGGNMLETLGYAVSNAVAYSGITGWGETISQGAHDVSLTNLFESGISGSTGNNFAELVFNNLQSGWYTIYVGGTKQASAGGRYDIDVSASVVPLPAAVYLLGAGFVGLLGLARGKSDATALTV